MKEKKDTQITGNVGMFYVCYLLSLKGWNAMPTSRNARGIDILAYKNDKMKKIQVKTLSKKAPVPLGNKKPDNTDIEADFWVIVTNVSEVNFFNTPQEGKKEKPFVHIMTTKEVWNHPHVGKGTRKRKNDNLNNEITDNDNHKVSFWLQPKDYEEFDDDWERVLN